MNNPSTNFALLKELLSKLVGDAAFRNQASQNPQAAFAGYRLNPNEFNALKNYALRLNGAGVAGSAAISAFASATPWG